MEASNWVFFVFFFLALVTPSFTDNDSRETPPPDINSNNSPSPLPSPPPPSPPASALPFRPSIAVIVGVLTTIFSMTFLLLLYAKHCIRGSGIFYNNNQDYTGYPQLSMARKNSGIDRTVIESLPIFRFGSLRGQKDGLECAVCLTKFGPTEVLRLLPKCKHAFHVECVDTWLDSHSTCPLCRYRVDPEDILLVEDSSILHHESRISTREDPGFDIENQRTTTITESEPDSSLGFRRVSGRHSSAGERGSLFRDPASSRRSFDSARHNKRSESVAVGCFDRPRKDGLLLAGDRNLDRRLEHRIIVSAGFEQRWSDVQPADLLYLRSEMIIGDSHRISSASSRPSVKRQDHQRVQLGPVGVQCGINNNSCENGRSVINTRSMSEITGMSRFSSSGVNRYRNGRNRGAGVASRWRAWISSRSQLEPNVGSDRSNGDVNNSSV